MSEKDTPFVQTNVYNGVTITVNGEDNKLTDFLFKH